MMDCKGEIIKFIDSKMELYIKLRSILYTLIDINHYSPSNLEVFKSISDITIRLDELYQLKMELTRRNNES